MEIEISHASYVPEWLQGVRLWLTGNPYLVYRKFSAEVEHNWNFSSVKSPESDEKCSRDAQDGNKKKEKISRVSSRALKSKFSATPKSEASLLL
jgi:hypothetical protein